MKGPPAISKGDARSLDDSARDGKAVCDVNSLRWPVLQCKQPGNSSIYCEKRERMLIAFNSEDCSKFDVVTVMVSNLWT